MTIEQLQTVEEVKRRIRIHKGNCDLAVKAFNDISCCLYVRYANSNLNTELGIPDIPEVSEAAGKLIQEICTYHRAELANYEQKLIELMAEYTNLPNLD